MRVGERHDSLRPKVEPGCITWVTRWTATNAHTEHVVAGSRLAAGDPAMLGQAPARRPGGRVALPSRPTGAGAARLLLSLAAVAEGLSAACVGVHRGRELRASLGIPGEWPPLGVVLVGRGAPDTRSPPSCTASAGSLDEQCSAGQLRFARRTARVRASVAGISALAALPGHSSVPAPG
jgi:hypothetical protein